MPRPDYDDDDRRPQWKRPRAGAVVVGLLLLAAAVGMVYSSFRIDVGTGEMAILIHKVGTDLANGDEVAPGPEYKGVQREVLTEGRYFRNPYEWEWEVVPQVVIPQGKLGVKISLVHWHLMPFL